MATILQLRRGTSTQHNAFTGAVGEVTVDTTKQTIVVHDGTTQGGSPLATEAFVTTTLQAADSLAELSGNSDDISEGSTNLFFTDTRARAAISVTGAGSYNSATGVIDITGGVTSVNSLTGAVVLDTDDISEGANQYFTQARARGAVSVTDNGGDGSLSYNNTTGVFSYTGPSASEVRAHFSAGTGVTLTNGQFSIDQSVATSAKPTFAGATLTDDVDVTGDINPTVDNTYSLGSPTKMWKDVYIGPGSLYVNGQKVLEETSGNIVVSADLNQNLVLQTSGSGDVELDPTGNGVVAIKGPMQIQAGSNIASSDGNAINFSNSIAVDAVTSKTTNGNLVLSGNGTGGVTVDDNINITGNLTVTGTVTTINSETIALADNLLDLNSNFTTGAPTENAGLRVIRGDEANVQVRWNETTDKWQYTNDGTNYNNIGNVSTLADLSLTATATELNYVDGVTSAIQTQLDAKFASADFNSSFDTRLGTKSTTNLAEGTNLYFTNSRARGALSAGSGISYDSATGAISADTTVVATKSYVDTAVASKDNTDEITEGSTNLYFTTARARSAISAGTGISITDGAISTTITQYTDALARAAVSVTDSGGDGSLSYNNTTGVITYTGPSASDVRAHFSAGTGITITNGAVAVDSTIATKTYADNAATTAVAAVIDAAPATLDTLNELAAALGDDANFATTVTDSIATKLNSSAVSAFGLTLVDDADAATARATLGLGTAATTAASAYATAAQGTKADNALPAASVSAFGGTLIDDADAAAARTTLGLGTAATTAATDYATAAQGTKADNALPASSYTAADVLTKIKTVDGAGSGLDADLLDGQSSAYFRINIYDATGTLLN